MGLEGVGERRDTSAKGVEVRRIIEDALDCDELMYVGTARRFVADAHVIAAMIARGYAQGAIDGERAGLAAAQAKMKELLR